MKFLLSFLKISLRNQIKLWLPNSNLIEAGFFGSLISSNFLDSSNFHLAALFRPYIYTIQESSLTKMRKWWIGCLRHKQQKMKDLFCVRNFTATKFWLNGLWHFCNLFSWTEYAIFLSFPNPLWNLAHGVFTLGTTGTMAIMKFIYIQKRIVIIYVCLSSSLIGKVFVSTWTELVTKQNICTCLEL